MFPFCIQESCKVTSMALIQHIRSSTMILSVAYCWRCGDWLIFNKWFSLTDRTYSSTPIVRIRVTDAVSTSQSHIIFAGNVAISRVDAVALKEVCSSQSYNAQYMSAALDIIAKMMTVDINNQTSEHLPVTGSFLDQYLTASNVSNDLSS